MNSYAPCISQICHTHELAGVFPAYDLVELAIGACLCLRFNYLHLLVLILDPCLIYMLSTIFASLHYSPIYSFYSLLFPSHQINTQDVPTNSPQPSLPSNQNYPTNKPPTVKKKKRRHSPWPRRRRQPLCPERHPSLFRIHPARSHPARLHRQLLHPGDSIAGSSPAQTAEILWWRVLLFYRQDETEEGKEKEKEKGKGKERRQGKKGRGMALMFSLRRNSKQKKKTKRKQQEREKRGKSVDRHAS